MAQRADVRLPPRVAARARYSSRMLQNPTRLAHETVKRHRELKLVAALATPKRVAPTREFDSSELVVSLTSHPARILYAWRSIETLLRQVSRQGLTLLVLCEEEFPRRELPRRLKAQQRRGLEILWVSQNGRSFDKLLPARKIFPGSHIITVDDDLYFPGNLVDALWEQGRRSPGAIVGARGWRVQPSRADGKVRFGTDWVRAETGDSGRGLHMPGGNGCLYPPNSLHSDVDNLGLALRLAPTNDDIWFWIQAIRAGSDFVCLGMGPHIQVRRQTKTYALSKVNHAGQEEQFQSVLGHFSIDAQSLCWKN